jgi:hypothetical protein|tara:strand:- start:256 stop:441 length:186 start_codon:yes stop_codon:yes gene_type:complete
MFTITEEQRKQLLAYMWQRPYGEVAQHIAMLAGLKPQTTSSTMETTQLVEKKNDGSKKDLS